MSRKGLVFVGLGLSGVDGMTVQARRELEACDEIYAEFYTSHLIGASLEDLERSLGREIKQLDRLEVEEEDHIIARAREMRVAFVTAGDSMAATTHVDLRIRAEEEGLPVHLIPGVSVFSACPSALGLQPYKFGRTITIPFPEEGYHPRSPYDNIIENWERGLHSMLLLDIKADEGRYMSGAQAIEWLLDAEERWGGGLMSDETLVCVAARLGSEDQLLAAGWSREIMARDLGGPLHTLVIPGRLHFMEAEALVRFAGAPSEILED